MVSAFDHLPHYTPRRISRRHKMEHSGSHYKQQTPSYTGKTTVVDTHRYVPTSRAAYSGAVANEQESQGKVLDGGVARVSWSKSHTGRYSY